MSRNNFRGFEKIEAFIVTVLEGDGVEGRPYTEVEYLMIPENKKYRKIRLTKVEWEDEENERD